MRVRIITLVLFVVCEVTVLYALSVNPENYERNVNDKVADDIDSEAQVVDAEDDNTSKVETEILADEQAVGEEPKVEVKATSTYYGGGVTYIRWGRTVCNGDATVLYQGQVGGTPYIHGGGGSNRLCMPDNPQWNRWVDGIQHAAEIWGAEYEFDASTGSPFSTSNNGGQSLMQHDIPCVVCHVATRTTQIMIPARTSCPTGWTREYFGYLTAEKHNLNRVLFECMDEAPQTLSGGHANSDGSLFYPVQAYCGSLKCPQYIHGREITCVVCTK